MTEKSWIDEEIAPQTGNVAADMRKQVKRAARELKAHPHQFVSDGLVKVADLIENYRGPNKSVPFGMIADILVALASPRVRDDAWSRMDPKHAEAHTRLWTHLTRLAPPGGFVSAPASMLAFVAWQQGDRPLAYAALKRALADNPEYSMAQLLHQVMDAGAPPSLARLPMSPEEAAESYKERESEKDGE